MFRFSQILLVSTLIFGVIAEDDPIISFKDGRIGVNFLGFKASAGLGGLLTGNPEHGGLHASAETPFGQKASAGSSMSLGDSTNGGLYAKADSGYGQKASAGLGGTVGNSRSEGALFANADSGYGPSVSKFLFRANNNETRLNDFLSRLISRSSP